MKSDIKYLFENYFGTLFLIFLLGISLGVAIMEHKKQKEINIYKIAAEQSWEQQEQIKSQQRKIEAKEIKLRELESVLRSKYGNNYDEAESKYNSEIEAIAQQMEAEDKADISLDVPEPYR